MKYTVSKEQKNYYSSVLLLENMVNFKDTFPVLLEGDDKLLEDILIYMAAKGWLEITGTNYVPTLKGREVLVNYKERLEEFRSLYKVYSAVDTGEGTFGYSSYFEYDSDEQFYAFLDGEDFEDLRVAVCEFKKIDPLDVIFMEMVDSDAFATDEIGWQAELITGLVWADMEDIANSNLSVEDLTEYDDDNNEIITTGEEVIKIIIKQGVELCKELIAEQKVIDEEAEEEEEEEEDDLEDEVEETTTTTTTTTIEEVEDPYYEPDFWDCYYDPFYVSPCWGVCYY